MNILNLLIMIIMFFMIIILKLYQRTFLKKSHSFGKQRVTLC